MEKNYNLSAWICFINATITIPLILMSFASLVNSSMTGASNFLYNLLAFVSVGFSAYIYLSFKEVLNKKYSFYEINNFIDIMVISSIVFYIATLFLSPFSEIRFVLEILFLITIGLLEVIIGVKVFSFKGDLKNVKEILGISLIVLGVCTASIILFQIGIVASIIFDISLGIFFLRISASLNS